MRTGSRVRVPMANIADQSVTAGLIRGKRILKYIIVMISYT